MAYLEVNIDPILRAPVRECSLDEPLPDVHFYGNPNGSLHPDQEIPSGKENHAGTVKRGKIKKSKRKGRQPVFKGPTPVEA